MNRLQFKIVRELFHELSEMSPKDQARILSERELDLVVREELETLLDASESTGAFEEEELGVLGGTLVARKLDDYGREEPVPEAIGPYRVLRKIGSGGMGLVYAAQREGTDALAAVKVIRPAVDSSSFLRRFRREVRSLRSLRHVGIAAFHDEGTATIETDTGRARLPFLAMELVEGVPLTQYAAEHDLGDRERVELIALVCDALQHAHDKHIVHRDLKPSNILVVGSPGEDGVGQPKLLDFGIARAIDADAQTLTVTTAGILMGTLPYMSPEQVGSARASIDARSDVYSLGVTLYELLAGRLPYPVRGLSIPQATRIIQEEEPTRLGSVVGRLRGDLELIVATALEKKPRHRYVSAAALAADLRRYLAGEPIHARSPAFFTRAIRFTRRHKALAAVALTVFSSLSVALVVTAYFGAAASRRAQESRAMTYRTSMRAAALARSVGDLAEVRGHLRDAPAELRGWEWRVLDASMDDSLSVWPVDFEESPRLVRFADSGSELVLLSRKLDESAFTVRVLDAEDGETLRQRRIAEPDSIGLSPNGEWIVRRDDEGRVYRERAEGGAQRVHLGESEGRLWGALASNAGPSLIGIPGGRRYLAPGADGSVEVVEFLGGYSHGLSPDGRRLAFWNGGKLTVWDAVNGRRESAEPANEGTPRFGPDPNWVCLVPASGTELEIWRDEGPGPITLAHRLVGHSRKIVCVAFSADGNKLASGGDDQSVRLWDLETGEHLATRVGHTGLVRSLAFSPDGTRLASWGEDSTLRVWGTVEDARVLPHGSYVYGARFSPDGARIYTVSWDSFVRVFDTESGAEVARWPMDGVVGSLAVGPGGRWVAAATRGSIIVFDSVDGRKLARLEEIASEGLPLAASPVEDSLLILDREGGELVLLDVPTGERIASRSLRAGENRGDVEFSSDGSRVGVALRDAGCLLLDARSLDVVREIPVHARSVAFSPDGRELAVATDDSEIHLVRLDTNDDAVVLTGHTAIVHELRYTPDGRRLVSGSGDHTMGIWDPARKELIARLWNHADYVFDIDVGPDGERVVTASGDGTARIWEPYPLAERLAAVEDREARLERLRPLIRERVERDGLRVTAEGLQGDPVEPGWDARDRELALQVLLGLGLED